MNNQNNRSPLSLNDKIADAIGYWAGAQPDHQSITVDDIQRRRHRRTLKRYTVGIGCLLALTALPLALMRPNNNHPDVQIAHHQSPPLQTEQDPLTQAKSNDAQLAALLAQIEADKQALQQQLAVVEKSRLTARIDRSFALAEKARQWAAEQQPRF